MWVSLRAATGGRCRSSSRIHLLDRTARWTIRDIRARELECPRVVVAAAGVEFRRVIRGMRPLSARAKVATSKKNGDERHATYIRNQHRVGLGLDGLPGRASARRTGGDSPRFAEIWIVSLAPTRVVAYQLAPRRQRALQVLGARRFPVSRRRAGGRSFPSGAGRPSAGRRMTAPIAWAWRHSESDEGAHYRRQVANLAQVLNREENAKRRKFYARLWIASN